MKPVGVDALKLSGFDWLLCLSLYRFFGMTDFWRLYKKGNNLSVNAISRVTC